MFNMFAGGARGAHGDLRPQHHAVHLRLHHHAADDDGRPHLEQLKKEGEQGRKKINQYTRYGTVILAAFQAYGIAVGLEGARATWSSIRAGSSAFRP
jgi:preprotein translocase subunit SecY